MDIFGLKCALVNENRFIKRPGTYRTSSKQIARHYAEVRQLDLAEKYFINAGEFVEAFEMYVRANKWDQAYQVITRYLPESEYTMIQV